MDIHISGDFGGRRGGDMLPAHQLQGELAISVPRHRHPRETITAGKGWGICRFTHTSQACRARPRTTRHAALTPESSLRGHCSQNRVGSDVASPATVRPWGRWLVVYHSTCRPLSSSPPREQLCNRSCSNKHTHPGAGPPAAGSKALLKLAKMPVSQFLQCAGK